VQTRILERETAVGADHQEKLAEIATQKEAAEARLKTLTERWDKERNLVGQIREVRAKLESAAGRRASAPETTAADSVRPARRATGKSGSGSKMNSGSIAACKRSKPSFPHSRAKLALIRVCVDAQIVGEVLSAWTGIPGGQDAQG
jgi:type VI secretion system protein VasG